MWEGRSPGLVLHTDTTKSADTGRWSLIVTLGCAWYDSCSTAAAFECMCSILSVHAGFRLPKWLSGRLAVSSPWHALDVVTKLIRGYPGSKAVRPTLRLETYHRRAGVNTYGRCISLASLKFSNALRSLIAFRSCNPTLSATQHFTLNPSPDSPGRTSAARLNLLLQAQATLKVSGWSR